MPPYRQSFPSHHCRHCADIQPRAAGWYGGATLQERISDAGSRDDKQQCFYKIEAIDCVTLDVPQLAESAFTSNVYDNCKVNVLGDKIPLFRAAAGWRNFKWFLDAGVDDVVTDEADGEPLYFNLRGEPIATPEIPGIYIELRNGKSRKIYVQ